LGEDLTARAPRPPDEAQRLVALRAHEVLDTPPEPAFDALVQLASDICGAPLAVMALVDDHREWFKAKVGVVVEEAEREIAFCAHAICHEGVFTIEDAHVDPRFCDNPLVTGEPHVRFYAGAPLTTAEGHNIGTLCVMDHVPRQLTQLQTQALLTLAEQVSAQIALRSALRRAKEQEALVRAQRDDLQRVQREKEELSALVVHDLKNPLDAVLTNAHFVAGTRDLDEAREAAQDIVSSAEAMQRMVMNLLDISAGEGDGMVPLHRQMRVGELLGEVCRTEHRLCAASGRSLVVVNELGDTEIEADGVLLRRVVENLVDNSRKYGAGPIRVGARADGPDAIRVFVADEGPGVAPDERQRIFEAHARCDRDVENALRTSHGLGLAFCRMAVTAHGGELWVEDNVPRGSVFCVRLPRRQNSMGGA
jgi:signal transduction histidine kinase